MPVSSNRRQRIIEYATPKVADLVVVEVVDASKNVKSAGSADNTAYGTAHPDSTNFPSHKLAKIKNADTEQGQRQYWYYVVDRSDQDDYNWEYQTAGSSGTRYDTVVRTYITLRSSYDDSSPELNSAMPISTSDPFASTDGYILFEKRQVRAGDDTLDSLYVIDRRIYVKKVPIRHIRIDDTFPYDINTRTATLGVSRIDRTHGAYGALVDKETLFFRTEQLKATTSFKDGTTGEADTLVNAGSSTKAEAGFRSPDLTYDTDLNLDDGTGQITNFWGTDELGIEREGKQLSANWYVLFERQVVPPVNTTTGEVTLAKYRTTETFSWPAVLNPMSSTDDLQNGVVGYSWKRKKGGKDTVVFPTYKRNNYTGPSKLIREMTWRKRRWEDGDLDIDQPMQPLPIDFVTPLIRTSIKPTLHAGMTLGVRTGNDHPVYNDESVTFTYGQTNYTDWPAYLVTSDTQKPFRGGYLREKITVYAPEISAITNMDPYGGFASWSGG
jgi:hypothetical protein